MRIGIDFHVVDGKFQGSRTHVIELFAEIIRQSPEIQFFLFLDRPDELPTISPAFAAANVIRVKMPYTNPAIRLLKQLPALQKQYQLDVLHTQYILPIPCRCKGMVTIHDVLFESHPQYFKWSFRLRSRLLMRYAAKHAEHVFTVSDYSKSEIAKRYNIAQTKITVTQNAADPRRFYPGNEGLELIIARGLTRQGYILSVGRLEPRKNHVTLIRAYAKLTENTLPLVIVGQRDFNYGGLFDEIKSLDLKHKVIIIEDANDNELPALYRHARLFVYPAFAEGFGMPPLEAMASGVPVISSNTTSIPEVVGDAGLLINPNDDDALQIAIQTILNNPAFSEKLVAHGLEKSKHFRWEESAKKVRQQYLSISKETDKYKKFSTQLK